MAEEGFTMTKDVSTAFEETIELTKKAMATEGFGVLTEIPFSAVVKRKLDKDVPKTHVLGTCNPHLAYGMYQLEKDVTALLPCNVVIREKEDGGAVEVCVMDPMVLVRMIPHPEAARIGRDARAKILKVLETLE